MASSTLFDRLGGASVVKEMVEDFYKRLLDDEKLALFFEDTKVSVLKNHQLQFLKLAFTEIPHGLDVDQMLIKKHRRLFLHKGLDESHFDLVANHFVQTLHNFQVSQNLIDQAVAIVLSLRPAFESGSAQCRTSATDRSDEKKEDTDSDSTTTATATSTSIKPKTLMDKLGGSDAVKVAVEGIYARILADEQLASFFETASLTALKLHMVDFMKIAFTQVPKEMNAAAYIQAAHAPLFKKGLNASHFDRVADHFVATLEQLQVSSNVIHEAANVILPLRPIFEQGAEQTSVE